MLDSKAAKVIVSPQYEKFVECWNCLEEAHDNYMEVAEFDVEVHPEGMEYLEGLGAQYRDLIKKYADFLNSSMNEERAIESASRKEIERKRLQ